MHRRGWEQRQGWQWQRIVSAVGSGCIGGRAREHSGTQRKTGQPIHAWRHVRAHQCYRGGAHIDQLHRHHLQGSPLLIPCTLRDVWKLAALESPWYHRNMNAWHSWHLLSSLVIWLGQIPLQSHNLWVADLHTYSSNKKFGLGRLYGHLKIQI